MGNFTEKVEMVVFKNMYKIVYKLFQLQKTFGSDLEDIGMQLTVFTPFQSVQSKDRPNSLRSGG